MTHIPQSTDAAVTHQIEFNDVGMSFSSDAGTVEVLRSVSLSVQRGEFLALLGPSGCGKSTLLNLTGGLLSTSSGSVHYAGDLVTRVNTKVGYVTQRDNLLPWRTVRGNVNLPLEIRGDLPRAERRDRVDAMLDMLGLGGFGDYLPAQLSGGMRKRVTLARTLIYEPETLLMDEPFGALDAQLRQSMQQELLSLWTSRKMTVLFVTHDLGEAVALADRVAIFSKRPGTIRTVATIDLPRPRDVRRVRFDRRFGELTETLWDVMADDEIANEQAELPEGGL